MFNTIVVGTDGSPTAQRAVVQAAELAKAGGATLHVVAAYSPTGLHSLSAGAMAVASVDVAKLAHDQVEYVKGMLEATAAEVRQQGIEVATYALTGDPAQRIVEIATTCHADLIVVGNRGMTGTRRLLGSVPNKVAHSASCNVLIVHTA